MLRAFGKKFPGFPFSALTEPLEILGWEISSSLWTGIFMGFFPPMSGFKLEVKGSPQLECFESEWP